MSLPSLAQDSIPGGAALPLAGAGIAPAESAGLILAHRRFVKGKSSRQTRLNLSLGAGAFGEGGRTDRAPLGRQSPTRDCISQHGDVAFISEPAPPCESLLIDSGTEEHGQNAVQ